MSTQKEENENFQVYDNDDAYLFGEIPENNYNNEYHQENNKINNTYKNNNINKVSNNNKIINKLDKDYINEKKNEKNNLNNNNLNRNKNTNNNIINTNVQDITFNKKYSINDMDSELENENNIFKVEGTPKLNENNDNPHNDKLISKNENNNEEIENEESNESNIPLVTLNFLSICQCCKDPFNSTNCIPYLFKCGHFFCKKCILEQFIDEEGIKCPNDGLVAKSISELKILNNFITDKTVTQRTSSSIGIFCNYHKGQRLTHYIEETKELICIYCAFEKFKQNPNLEIKEINDKFKEIEIDIDNIIDDNQNNVGVIQNSLIEIKKNKEIEEKKVNEIFNKLSEIINTKREDNLNKINTLFSENAKKLRQKLELFSSKIEKCEEIKEKISLYKENKEQSQLSFILNEYNKLIAKINETNYYKLILQKYKFVYDDEPIIIRLINKLGDFKIFPNNCAFIGNKKNNTNNLNTNINYKNDLNYNQSNSKLNINQSQSRMNINIFTNINQDKTPSTINEPVNIIKKKLKANKSYSNISPYQRNKKKINHISNNYNSFYKHKIIETNINENVSNLNSINYMHNENNNIYNNYKNNIHKKSSKNKKKLNNTLDFDINVKKKNNANNSTTGMRVNTSSGLIKKTKLNTGIYTGNKFDLINPINNNEQKFNVININQSGNKKVLSKIKNNK